jgi:hypothetical protein
MCPDSQRADALNAVTLVENVARLATQGLFGFIFASLAEVGKAYATFFCNAVSYYCTAFGGRNLSVTRLLLCWPWWFSYSPTSRLQEVR